MTEQQARAMTQEELKEYSRKKYEEAKQRQQNRMITLRELLMAMVPEEPLPDEWEEWDDFRPQSVYKILLCFMSEEETWIEAYRDHVMLIPWYDCKVLGFYAGDEKYTMQVWLAYDEYIPKLIRRNA